MTQARKNIVDVTVTRWYHCLSRCVRGGFLMGEGYGDRKAWIEQRLERLTANFAVSVGGFAILDNHLHVLTRLDPEDAVNWSAEEVVRRWITIYPPLSVDLADEQVVQVWVEQQAKDLPQVAIYRDRLTDLGWFMKALKEPLSRAANKADGCRGAFWEARYKSIAILDTEALLATCVYIDLNPLAAGMAETPERSPFTSIHQRILHAKSQGKIESLSAARKGSVAGSQAAGNVEQNHWLVPIEDRRTNQSAASNAALKSTITAVAKRDVASKNTVVVSGKSGNKLVSSAGTSAKSIREGMLETFSLGSYLLLVDYTSRLYRNGKARLNSAVKEVFERLNTSQEFWSDRIQKMLSSRDLRGNFFGTNSESIQSLSAQRGQRMPNLSPQAAVAS